jgi:hypothetical protein
MISLKYIVHKIVIALNAWTKERPLYHQINGHSAGPCDGKKYTDILSVWYHTNNTDIFGLA